METCRRGHTRSGLIVHRTRRGGPRLLLLYTKRASSLLRRTVCKFSLGVAPIAYHAVLTLNLPRRGLGVQNQLNGLTLPAVQMQALPIIRLQVGRLP